MKPAETDRSHLHLRVCITIRPNGTTQIISMKHVLVCLYRIRTFTYIQIFRCPNIWTFTTIHLKIHHSTQSYYMLQDTITQFPSSPGIYKFPANYKTQTAARKIKSPTSSSFTKVLHDICSLHKAKCPPIKLLWMPPNWLSLQKIKCAVYITY